MPSALRTDAARIAHLAWPVLVGQLAVLAFGTIDTVLLARQSSTELAVLAVGSAAYITVFVGLMGVLLAIGPIVGQLFGAKRYEDAGRQFHQAVWLALFLSAGGCAVLAWPTPFLMLAQAEESVAQGVRGYLGALAFALPAALLFTVYRGFNTAISRPREVMRLQVLGLAFKLPLSMVLAWGVPSIGLPALGAVGCGLATVIVMWLQCAAAAARLLRDPAYDRFALLGRGLDAPDRAMLAGLLKLGIPMGAGILIEVTGFTFMAIFIARLGALPVAGHQIAANLTAMLFMVPLALSNATSTLVAQRLGARDLADATRLSWNGLKLATILAVLLASLLHLLKEPVVNLYTRDATVAAVALALLGWVVWFHVADAIQTMAALVLRAYRVATWPVVIYAVSLWGLGLGGGYVLAFSGEAGASGFWLTSTLALWTSAALLVALMAWVIRQRALDEGALSLEPVSPQPNSQPAGSSAGPSAGSSAGAG